MKIDILYILGVLGVFLIFILGFTIGQYNKVPYEQTYDYLFGEFENRGNNITRVSYYGHSYLVSPLVVKNCGVNDYIEVIQYCYGSVGE